MENIKNTKKIYMAPMEGLTGHIFRQQYEKHFGRGNIDKYFIPFISPNQSDGYTTRELNDINPDNNRGMNAVPQIMANNAEYFIKAAVMLGALGYKEVNLNLGCPSGTVVAKYRGAGFLAKLDKLDMFLDRIFNEKSLSHMDVSIKTRLGMEDTKEFERLLDIYNKYPLKELIVHPRVREDYYKDILHMDSFKYALDNCASPIGYNGDIVTIEDYGRLLELCRDSSLDSVMMGRGFVRNPLLIEDITGTKSPNPGDNSKKIKAFVRDIFEGYLELMPEANNAMHKMKEIWVYIADSFSGGEKAVKEIKKSNSVSQYKAAVDNFFAVSRFRY